VQPKLRFTILQPSVFMEVWLSPLLGWDARAGVATIAGEGKGLLTWISVADVGEMAVRSLTEPRLVNQTLSMGGPARISAMDVVKIFEDVAKKPFRIKRVPVPLLRIMGPVVALFNEGIASGMSLMAQTVPGESLDLTLQNELCPPTVSVRDYVGSIVSGAA
jgi:uncharacterized protein YbjT (DUF2867 family)